MPNFKLKLKPEVKKKWVEALESGDYKQIRGKLRAVNGYCCLGVLCELYAKEGVDPTDKGRFVLDRGYYTIHNTTHTVPKEIQMWAFKDYDGSEENGNPGFCFEDVDRVTYQSLWKLNDEDRVTYQSLWKLNDEDRKTFPEIAKVIKEKF